MNETEKLTDIEFVIRADDGTRICVSNWDDGGVFLSMQVKGASMCVAMSREKAQDVLVGLREILSQTLGDE